MIPKTPLTVIRGFLMGAADVVPGVSGGTIALVVGIYEQLVESIRAGSSALGHIVRGNWSEARRWLSAVDWGFLIPLILGILLAVISLASVLKNLLHDQPEEMAGLFMGLIAGSVVVAWKLVKTWSTINLFILVGVTVAIFILLGLSEGTSDETVGQLNDPALWAFFGAGAIAVCAMILPGVSGSFLLVILGMYGPVLESVNDRDIAALGIMIIGMTIGLALFSQALSWALHHYHDAVMAALIGLMAGSIRVLWPWPDGLDSTALGAPQSNLPVVLGLAFVALLVVVALGRFSQSSDAIDERQLS
ncbi:MAG: DUF368 domain-containing protein [bacterium]|nr:DUF368 domain-containing protein [bacterium]